MADSIAQRNDTIQHSLDGLEKNLKFELFPNLGTAMPFWEKASSEIQQNVYKLHNKFLRKQLIL